MAEMNFKQITDKLNAEFTGDVRKLIFWYDAEGEFAEDVDTLELQNAKVYHLQKDNQFRTKLFLEREDRTTNYLIYAPFPKPDIRENHLADTIHYSKEFFADRASLLMLDLGMDTRCKPIIERYIKFFGEKKRTQAFYDLEISSYNRASIEIGLMSVLCRCKLPSFEEVLRCVLTDGELEENALLAEFEKYDLLKPFWEQCAFVFGYADEESALTKLVMMLFATYAEKCIHAALPQSWQPFVSFKSGNVIAFLDNLMNSVIYKDRFDELSAEMYKALDGENQLKKLPVEALTDCNLFAGVDEILLGWMNDRLLNEDVGARLNDREIPVICAARRKMHFGDRYHDEYFVVENAWNIIKQGAYTPLSGIDALTKAYTSELYQVDMRYRYFYYYYDRIEDNAPYEKLRSLTERIYTNDYLNPLAVNFAEELEAAGETSLLRQHEFYNIMAKYANDRVAVIISDALRYEVGRTLFERLGADEKCDGTLRAMQSVLPSITRAGMAALLPQKTLDLEDPDNVLADGMPTKTMEQRKAIIEKAQPKSLVLRYEDIKAMSATELKTLSAEKRLIYIYHNQIDARGDKPASENEVFVACEEAVNELVWLVRRLTSCNTTHMIITADHGFIYKRDKLTGSDKIGGVPGANDRFVITEEPILESGICSLPLNKLGYREDDSRFINLPKGSDLFRAPGSGKNFVHGGCSPQELLVPVIDVKTEKAKKETTTAMIDLVSLLSKITNLITTLDFIQTEPVSDVVKETEYRVFFISDAGVKISSESMVSADRKDTDAAKRIFRLRFTFKNQKYDKSHKYYLVAVDNNGREVLRREVIMDLAFVDDFGF